MLFKPPHVWFFVVGTLNEYADLETTPTILAEVVGTHQSSVLAIQSWCMFPGACLFLHPLCASRLLRPKEAEQALFSCLESKFSEGCPLGRRM